MVQNNQFIFKVEDQSPFTIWFGGYIGGQHKPYHQYLRAIERQKEIPPIPELRSIVGRKIHLLMSDDALQMDFRAIQEFVANYLHCYEVEISFQSLYLSKEVKKYVAFTKTSRCIVIKYIKEGKVIQECFLPRSVEREEIKEAIEELHSDIKIQKIPILIIDNQENLEDIQMFGTLVSSSEIFENYEQIRKGY